MKKSSKLMMAVIVIAAIITTFFVGCKKEKDELSNKTNVTTTSLDNMDKYLMSFKQKMLSAQKGDESISLDDAYHNLSNLLNFDFGDVNHATDVYQIDTLHVKLAIDNGRVDLSQLAVTYNDAIERILADYRALDLPDKSVHSIYCEYDNSDDRDGETENVRVVVNYRGFGNESNMYAQHDTLDWRPKRYAGTCDGQYIGIHGGPDIMEQWLWDVQMIADCEIGSRKYYTDYEIWYKCGDDTWDPIANRFRIFNVITNNLNNVCIPHEDMEYYFSNILAYWNDEFPSSHEITYIYIQTTVNNANLNNWYWRVRTDHGKPNCTETSPIE